MTLKNKQPTTTLSCDKNTISESFIVLNDKGLHTRPSTEFVKCATQYRCEITLHYQGLSVNGKSLLGILTLAATRGARIIIEATGEHAADAIAALKELAENKFYIQY